MATKTIDELTPANGRRVQGTRHTTIKRQTLIGIQEEYIETINAGIERWQHSKSRSAFNPAMGGHASRIAGGARRKAEKQLRRIGFTNQKEIDQVLKDARDMAELIRNSKEE